MSNDQNSEIAAVFASYPVSVRKKLMRLRKLIFSVAAETDGVADLRETLKWGEPSYLAKGGSTLRIAWKQNRPDHYAMYFNCQTRLVDTFRELYGDHFQFEGNRAIVFAKTDRLPLAETKTCIALTLTYHKRKHLPLLGA